MAESEIELKLRLEPSAVDRFRRDPLIHRNKHGRAGSKPLMAVYFDTPDLDLRARKCALRIRREGRECVQTLKLSTGGAGLQHRLEFNAPSTASDPDLCLIDDADVRVDIEAMIGDKDLVPIFTTDIRRTIWMLDLPGGDVELALDIGRIESRGQAVAVCEAELELKGGTAPALLDFAEALVERYACQIAEESKAARGYNLYSRAEPTARCAEKLILSPTESAWVSLGKLVEAGTGQLFGNEAAILQGDGIDGIHQARVSVRRLRAALSVFSGILPEETHRPLNKALRRLQKALGPARDWDVLLVETLAPLMQEPDAPKSLARFYRRAEAARSLGYKTARKALRSRGYGRLQLALVRFPHLPEPPEAVGLSTKEVAALVLQERLETLLTAGGKDPSQLPEDALHALRMDIKTLRYAIDFFQSIYPRKRVIAWRSTSRKLQDCLGGLNDALVHDLMIDALDTPDHPVPGSVRRYLAAYHQQKIDAELATLSERWTRFEDLVPFWS